MSQIKSRVFILFVPVGSRDHFLGAARFPTAHIHEKWGLAYQTSQLKNENTEKAEQYEEVSSLLTISKSATNKHGWTMIDGSTVNRTPSPTPCKTGGCGPEINSGSEAC